MGDEPVNEFKVSDNIAVCGHSLKPTISSGCSITVL